MNIKDKKFVKNLSLTAIASIVGGAVGAKLASMSTDSKSVISLASLLGQTAASYGAFIPLHLRDNPDLYRDGETGSFKGRVFMKDIAKLTFGLGLLDYAYNVGRPLATYYFQKNGYEPVTSSLLADSVCIPAYLAFAIPMGKALGITRDENKK
ncbi:MAG: hypothetical protein AABW82_02540 [Nanoarchaeota archaeon]